MQKKCIVRLAASEGEQLVEVVRKVRGGRQESLAASVVVERGCRGLNWTDFEIADVLSGRTRTGERLRQRFCEQRFEVAADRLEQKDLADCEVAQRQPSG